MKNSKYKALLLLAGVAATGAAAGSIAADNALPLGSTWELNGADLQLSSVALSKGVNATTAKRCPWGGPALRYPRLVSFG